jgi:hypothetical protein
VPVGTTFVQRGSPLRPTTETATTVTTYQPPTRFGYRGEGPIPYEAQCAFDAVPDGRHLTADVASMPEGAHRLLEPVLAPVLIRFYRANLDLSPSHIAYRISPAATKSPIWVVLSQLETLQYE